MLESAVKYFLQNKLYIWQRRKINKDSKKANVAKAGTNLAEEREMKLTGSKLKDLAWSLDVLDLSKNQN